MTVDNLTLRSLVHAKRLYLHGIEHSEDETEIDRIVAILHLDNAIERMIYCILTSKGQLPKKNDFFASYDMAQNLSGSQSLSQFKHGILELHNLRNSVQHAGTIPSSEDISKYEDFTKEFLTKVPKEVFDIDFERISLSLFIRNNEVRDLYTQAERAFYSNDYETCLLNCVRSFDAAKQAEQISIHGSGLIISLAMMEDQSKKNPDIYGMPLLCIGVIAEELEVLKLRMDYKGYRKFADFYPDYHLMGNLEVKEITEGCDSKENAFYALNFVLDCILKWESLRRHGWDEPIHSTVQDAKPVSE